MFRGYLVLLVGLQITAPVTQEPAPQGEIRGRVTDKETGQPLPRAWVRLHAKEGPERWSTRTDDGGRYRFRGLSEGEYTGIVDAGPSRATHATGFLTGDRGGPVVLKDGETREVDVALTRTFAIDVRVIDEWGDPLSGVTVSASSAGSGRPSSLVWNHYDSTDDHGRQRVFGLEPGRYVVCAETGFAGQDVEGGVAALLRTCHPSAIDETEAQVVRIDRSDVGQIEIRMRRGRTLTIAGRIVDASGAPAPGAHILLARHRPGGSTAMQYSVDDEGRFRIANVHPGEYAIEAGIGGPEQPEQRRRLERAFVPIHSDAADVSDLTVALQRTVDVAGRVTLEDATAALFVTPPGFGPVSVTSRLAGYTGSDSRLSPVDDTRSFTIKDVFGPRTLDVVNLPRGWYVRSIRYRGREIIDEPTTFDDSGGEPAIEIVLSNRGAVVVGRATDESGNAAARAMILMFPADSTRMSWRLPVQSRTSAAGEFHAGPVRPGEYCVVALPASARSIQPGESARLARLAAAAERITLSEFEEKTVDLRIVAER